MNSSSGPTSPKNLWIRRWVLGERDRVPFNSWDMNPVDSPRSRASSFWDTLSLSWRSHTGWGFNRTLDCKGVLGMWITLSGVHL